MRWRGPACTIPANLADRVRTRMEAADPAEDFIPAGLAAFGIEADEIELAVIGAAHALFWPGILGLLELDLEGVEPERNPDLAQGPEGS